MYNLINALQDTDHLSPCLYSTAICSLNSPQRSRFLAWLLKQRNPDGTWGHDLSWQDMYLTTYAVALAMINGGWDALATNTLERLSRLPAYGTDNRTLNFGGLIGTLDVFAQSVLDIHVEHPSPVHDAMVRETGKWEKIARHGEFYNPTLSIAGFFGECCYGLNVDLPRFLYAFQAANGSITNSPAASSMFLMAYEHAGLPNSGAVEALRAYVNGLNPYRKSISFLDSMDHQITSWLLLYLDQEFILPQTKSITSLTRAFRMENDYLICSGGDTTLPGDLDTTAAAVIGLHLPADQRQVVLDTLQKFRQGNYYRTMLYENSTSTSTNVHVAAAWPENPHLEDILMWLEDQHQENGLVNCKWHASPFYVLGEIGRLLWNCPNPRGVKMAIRAGQTLLEQENRDGGWGYRAVTREETSYAVLALTKLAAVGLVDAELAQGAIDRAHPVLEKMEGDYEPIWIGKTLYTMKPVSQFLQQLALERTAALCIA